MTQYITVVDKQGNLAVEDNNLAVEDILVVEDMEDSLVQGILAVEGNLLFLHRIH